jgi:chlorite dismutase/heme-degrading monooxygenase HmoA
MPERRDPPPTDEGWFVLHDFRRIDWDAWRAAPERDRQRALEDGIDHLQSHLAVEDSEEGGSALYSILGDKADFLVVHMRPTSADIGAIERRFEQTEFAGFTERASSFVSVTEASGYSERARDYFTDDLDENSGLYNYIQSRLKPTIPDATHVCFYPMDKRRDPEQNWYDLPFDERAEHMDAHGDIGRDYGGKVTQMITGAIAIDDWEWGVTLWGDDLTDMKDLLYEMRFDPSTSQYADFGPFYVGRRFPPEDLPAFLAGKPVPAQGEASEGEAETAPVHPAEAASPAKTETGHGGSSHAEGEHGGGHPHGEGGADTDENADKSHGGDDHSHGEAHGGSDDGDAARGGPPTGGDSDIPQEEVDDLTTRARTLGLQPGEEYGAGDYGLILYAEADAQDLAGEVDALRGDFEHYDSHVSTVVRAEGGRSAVVSVWANERAADTAHGFLTDLPGIAESVRGPLGDDGDDQGGESGHDGDEETDSESIREQLADLDIYAGKPHGEDVYALVLYSEADPSDLEAAVADLRDGFDRYDTHQGTDIYGDPDGDALAVVSLWDTEDAADTASGYLADLPGVIGWAGEGEGFGTMGMFYTVKPEHREDFVEKFGTVGDVLAEMDGHRETTLLVNREDENDMFIASQWDSKEDAMDFFRSDAFSDTVDWGRDVLADRPRHVFLA